MIAKAGRQDDTSSGTRTQSTTQGTRTNTEGFGDGCCTLLWTYVRTAKRMTWVRGTMFPGRSDW